MSVKITGLDQLQRTLKDTQKALTSLDERIATLRYDPTDPQSVKAAIREMEQTIDHKVSSYSHNPIVAPLVRAAKEQFRAQIMRKAKVSS